MSQSALTRLGQRMAARNNLPAFAWICALALPFGLQWLAGADDLVRGYLDTYYGPFTLYFFFTMTYGFAATFVAYYQLSGYRRAGTLDLLRVARLTPGEVLGGAYWQLQRILLPPIAGFALAFAAYLLAWPEQRGMLMGLGWQGIAGGLLSVALTEALLCAIVCLGLLRGEAVLAALCTLLILPLNTLPIALIFWAERVRQRYSDAAAIGAAREDAIVPDPVTGGWEPAAEALRMPLLLKWLTTAPWLWYVLALGLLIAAVLWLARARLARLWPPTP